MTGSSKPETAWRANNQPFLATRNTKLEFGEGTFAEFLYYKRHDISNTRFENGTEFEKYVRNIIATTTTGVWKMNGKPLQIWNDGALTLFEEMERMDRELSDLKKKTSKQSRKLANHSRELTDQKEQATGRNKLLWKLRVSELEAIIKKPHNAARFERNEISHGADVLNDYQALENANWQDNPAQYSIASEGFKKAYGFRRKSLKYNKLCKAPEELIDMLTMRGNVTFLKWFRKHKGVAGAIKEQCDAAMRKWQASMKANGVPYLKDAVKADYEQVKELYNSVRNQALKKWRP